MNVRHTRRIGAGLTGILIAGGIIVAPTAAIATTGETSTDAVCEITGGTLTWGVKESFRSYISGSIANGSWETAEGATYETPDFQWSDATGSIDPETGTGSVSFTGSIHFTGHDGVLDLTIANPTVEFDGDGKAALLLDTRGTDMEGEVAVDAEQQWVGEVMVTDPVAPTADALDLQDLPTTLTSEGAGAFADFYEAGQELDPLNLNLELVDCANAAAGAAAAGSSDTEGDEPELALDPAMPDEASAPVPWLPIGIGAAAVLVIGITTGMLIAGRKKSRPAEQTPAEEQTPPTA